MEESTAHGARFEGGVDDRGFGRAAALMVPGGTSMLVYEPRHAQAFDT